MSMRQVNELSRLYREAVYGGAKKKEEPKDTRLVVTAADKKANTPAYKNFKAGHKGYKAADHLKDDKDWGYDKDGNSLNPKDKRKNLKKEGFSNWRKDLKEIPDYDQIPVDAKKRNEKISEKNVKNTVKINPEMKEEATVISETEIEEGVYEKQKTKEVMGALKKRDLKTSVKKKIAADIVKKKGDTSKSDDRYAYESKLWDEVAANLTELGEMNDVEFRVVGLDEAERDLGDRLHRKRKLYDRTVKKAMDFARREGEAAGHARYRMGQLDTEMDKVKDKMKKEEVEVNEGVMKFIKDRVGGKKKSEKKAEMDKTTEKLHDLRREKFKTDKQKEHEKYVNFLPVDEEVVTELNRYGKETGKATGSLNKRPGSPVATRNEPNSAINFVRRNIIRPQTGRPEGQQKKVKGEKGRVQPGDRKFTPAQTISRMRAQVAAADAAMRDTRGT